MWRLMPHGSRLLRACQRLPMSQAHVSRLTLTFPLRILSVRWLSSSSGQSHRDLADISPKDVPNSSLSPYAYPHPFARYLEHKCAPEDKNCNISISTNPFLTMRRDIIQKFAALPITPLTLQHLMLLDTNPEHCYAFGRFLQFELPIRLAQRIQSILDLPPATQAHHGVRSILHLYWSSMESIRHSDRVTDDATQEKFAQLLEKLTEAHTHVVQILSRSLHACLGHKVLAPTEMEEFMDKMIRARIAIRIMAQHYLQLVLHRDSSTPHIVGIVNRKMEPANIVKQSAHFISYLCQMSYGTHPKVNITGDTHVTLPYIEPHFSYMVSEILKNAMRATVERDQKIWKQRCMEARRGVPGASFPSLIDQELPHISVDIRKCADAVIIAIIDRGGGIPAHQLGKIFDYGHTTYNCEADDPPCDDVMELYMRKGVENAIGPFAGEGYGLKTSKLTCEFFGGKMKLENTDDGCKVTLDLAIIDEALVL